MPSIAANEEIYRRSETRLRFGLGEHFGRMLDESVCELMLNCDGTLWQETLDGMMLQVGRISADKAVVFLRSVASDLGLTIDQDRPSLSCEVPIRNARLEATVPPLSPAPQFSIRLPAVRIFTLGDYEADGILTARQRAVIEDAIAGDLNIMVSGGTGSGKTTFGNALLHYTSIIRPGDRLVVVQDLYELQPSSANVAFLRTSGEWGHNDLVRICMRMRPDRIIIGEVRGGEAFALLKAMNTGHSGTIWTIHANTKRTDRDGPFPDARAALTRFENLIAEATTADKRSEIAQAVHLVVSIVKLPSGSRRVQEIVRVEGFHDGHYVLSSTEF